MSDDYRDLNDNPNPHAAGGPYRTFERSSDYPARIPPGGPTQDFDDDDNRDALGYGLPVNAYFYNPPTTTNNISSQGAGVFSAEEQAMARDVNTNIYAVDTDDHVWESNKDDRVFPVSDADVYFDEGYGTSGTGRS